MPRPIRALPWLEQRSNGWFYVHWYDARKRLTKRKSLKTNRASEANARYQEFIQGRPSWVLVSRRLGATVSEVLGAYFHEHVMALDDRGRPRVVARKRIEIAIRHLTAYFGDRPICDIGPSESRGYLMARREGQIGGSSKNPVRDRKAKDSTVRRELSIVNAAARHAVKWGAIRATDLPRIELPRIEEHGRVRWFTERQLRYIREAAFARDFNTYAFVAIAYYTAARRRSIENLLKTQVDLAAGTIDLQAPDGRRTKKRRPVVPIYPEIRPTVARLMQTPGEYLFGDDKSRNFYFRFVNVTASLGIQGAHPHLLRHSRASHLLQDGNDIWKVAQLLGDTVATVERVYAHSGPKHLLFACSEHKRNA